MKQRLEELAKKVETELLKDGTISVVGTVMTQNSSRDNPYAGLCHAAVAKLQELAPEMGIRGMSLEVPKRYAGGGRHVIGVVDGPDGRYIIDPTIKQYDDGARMVTGPNETYPLKIVQGSVREFPANNFI